MKIKQAHRSLGLLPVWSDVDTIADLKHLIQRAENTSFKSSQTMTYLRKCHMQLENIMKQKQKEKEAGVFLVDKKTGLLYSLYLAVGVYHYLPQ